MQIYLPIADIPVNIFLVLAMGLAVGFISGMFGIGGGFLMTPLLIFIGIPPAVAVASVADPYRGIVLVRRDLLLAAKRHRPAARPSCCWPAAYWAPRLGVWLFTVAALARPARSDDRRCPM